MEEGSVGPPVSLPSPPSPGVSPVRLSDCTEELLRFTLSSFVDGTLGEDMSPLSKDYCCRLLQDDELRFPLYPTVDSDGAYGASIGLPTFPLYKCLGQSLVNCINHQRFMRRFEPVVGIAEAEVLKWEENAWKDLIADVSQKLINMFKEIEFELHVQEPFFSLLKDGVKIVEGRCARGDYNRITPGSLLLVNKCLLLQVQHVKWYPSFLEMLGTETLSTVLPGVKTIEEGLQIYRNFYSEDKEMSNGVLAISVSRPNSQPYTLMANLLAGLSYEGIASLLGMTHTAGTIPDALPPLKSTLISSFISRHNPEFVGFLEPYAEGGYLKSWKH